MRLLVQRVKNAKVEVEQQAVGEINQGLLAFFGVHKGDTLKEVPWMVNKLCHLRIFRDENDKMNLSVKDIGAEILIVSQFTLYGDCSSGRRPSFIDALDAKEAEMIYDHFVNEVKNEIESVQTGKFGAYMQVSLINDGPVTFLIEN